MFESKFSLIIMLFVAGFVSFAIAEECFSDEIKVIYPKTKGDVKKMKNDYEKDEVRNRIKIRKHILYSKEYEEGKGEPMFKKDDEIAISTPEDKHTYKYGKASIVREWISKELHLIKIRWNYLHRIFRKLKGEDKIKVILELQKLLKRMGALHRIKARLKKTSKKDVEEDRVFLYSKITLSCGLPSAAVTRSPKEEQTKEEKYTPSEYKAVWKIIPIEILGYELNKIDEKKEKKKNKKKSKKMDNRSYTIQRVRNGSHFWVTFGKVDDSFPNPGKIHDSTNNSFSALDLGERYQKRGGR